MMLLNKRDIPVVSSTVKFEFYAEGNKYCWDVIERDGGKMYLRIPNGQIAVVDEGLLIVHDELLNYVGPEISLEEFKKGQEIESGESHEQEDS
jgi:hypothetical protein